MGVWDSNGASKGEAGVCTRSLFWFCVETSVVDKSNSLVWLGRMQRPPKTARNYPGCRVARGKCLPISL